MRKPFIRAIVGEGVTVETRQSISGAEPKEASRVSDDTVDGIVREAVSGIVGFDGQPFSAANPGQRHQAEHPKTSTNDLFAN